MRKNKHNELYNLTLTARSTFMMRVMSDIIYVYLLLYALERKRLLFCSKRGSVFLLHSLFVNVNTSNKCNNHLTKIGTPNMRSNDTRSSLEKLFKKNNLLNHIPSPFSQHFSRWYILERYDAMSPSRAGPQGTSRSSFFKIFI